MEVSNKIKEDIRKTQSDLKNAIRVHQIWVARLQEDENNMHLKTKVKEAEKDIIAIGHTQKLVVDRLRRELELYQQRLKARNKQVNIENDNRYVAQQLRDYQIQNRSRTRSVSLLKPSVLNEIHIKAENNVDELKDSISDSDNEKHKENSNSDGDEKDKYERSYPQMPNVVHDSRSNLTNALNKVKESLMISTMIGPVPPASSGFPRPSPDRPSTLWGAYQHFVSRFAAIIQLAMHAWFKIMKELKGYLTAL